MKKYLIPMLVVAAIAMGFTFFGMIPEVAKKIMGGALIGALIGLWLEWIITDAAKEATKEIKDTIKEAVEEIRHD
ncbi:hypothetical protein KKF38_03065 [Patescibacteria group bacterium]|nr:hypothetical protein [Patescibacteria group bacterium]